MEDGDPVGRIMKQRPVLEQNDVEVIISACRQAALASKANVSIAVVDDGGNLLQFLRMDGANLASVEVAPAKARTAVLTGGDSSHVEQTISSGRTALLSLQGVLSQTCALMAGGLVLCHEDVVVGAIGVSGMTPELDSFVANAGLQMFQTLQT